VRGDWSGDSATLQFALSGEPVRPQGWLYFMVESQIDELHAACAAAGVEILQYLNVGDASVHHKGPERL